MSRSQDELDSTNQELRCLLGRLEKRLAESEARYRALAESLGDAGFATSAAVLLSDDRGRLTRMSEDTTGILECTVEEVAALPGQPEVPGPQIDDRPTVLEWLRRAVGGDARSPGFPKLVTVRFRARHPRGAPDDYHWLEARLIPVGNENKELVGTEVLVRDVTAHTQSERIVSSLNAAVEAVQRQALGSKAVLELVTSQLARRSFVSAIALLDESGRYLTFAHVSGQERAVRAAEELTGLGREQDRIPVDSIPAYSRAIVKREPVYFSVDETFLAQMLPEEMKGVAKTAMALLPPLKMVVAPMIVDDEVVGLLAVYGETLSESCAPAVAAFANQTAIAMHNADLVARLRESEEQYRGIFEGATDGFLLLDEEGTIVEANPAACAMHGYCPEEIVGLPLANLVHPRHHRELSGLKEGVASQGHAEAQLVHVSKEGTTFHVEARGTRLVHRGQLHMLAAVLDITGRIREQQALLRAE